MRLIEQFPSDSRFRYVLTRGWDGPALGISYRRIAFVMLNPSTADEHEDDPTVRRCRSFAHDWGCDGIAIVNLFAYRTPSREALWSATGDVVGPENGSGVARRLSRGGPGCVCMGERRGPQRPG